ncbi:class I SAM-dependent methyltransferase [Marinobacter sp.]|uniref:class I SAM-dependent methyltransferase n=1 Tax=Marinobacter sp. TaxID=50741 RepID=UPI003850E661
MEQDKIWEAYQNDASLVGGCWPSGGRYSYLAKQVPAGAQVLNIGVGNGTLERLLIQKGAKVSCLDPSKTAIERLREELNLGENAQAGYSQAIPFPDDSFDVLIMSEVLEHLDDETLRLTLNEVMRVLRPAGRFIGTVPADENLADSLVVCPHCAEKFHRWGHVQSFSKERLVSVLGSVFGQVDVKRVALHDYQQLNWKGKLLAAATGVQAAADIKGSNQNFYFEACLG